MRIAERADRVILMAAGLPLTMKDRPPRLWGRAKTPPSSGEVPEGGGGGKPSGNKGLGCWPKIPRLGLRPPALEPPPRKAGGA